MREICNGRESEEEKRARWTRNYSRREGVFAWKAKRAIRPYGIERRQERPREKFRGEPVDSITITIEMIPIATSEFSEDLDF
jgi:hypothetical protein